MPTIGGPIGNPLLEKYTDRMGPSIGRKYYYIWQYTSAINFEWHQFNDLFGTNERRIKIFNTIAPQFWGRIQYIMLDFIVLGISRLLDKKRGTISIRKLIPDLKSVVDADLHRALTAELGQAEILTKKLSDRRNDSIAHLNLMSISQPSTPDQLSVSRAEIKEVINSINSIVTQIYMHYFDSDLKFPHDPTQSHEVIRAMHSYLTNQYPDILFDDPFADEPQIV